MKIIALTGGGTAGHVTPNIALIQDLLKRDWIIHYIGTKTGIEKDLISKEKNVIYHEIKAGKLRRYADARNFTDPFRVIMGIGQSAKLLGEIKPHIIFSKGGFVSVPVVLGGWLNRIPIIIHESDLTPGLANKISFPFTTKVCTTFPETAHFFKKDKGVYTGTPLRLDLFEGDAQKGMTICGFTQEKPVLMVMGGSLGALAINKLIRGLLHRLLNRFNIVHVCGKNNLDSAFNNMAGYKQFEYVNEELPHLFALASVIVSRAGANSIYEFLALKKPNILIPLPLSSSRGDQIENAKSFEAQGFSIFLDQDTLSEDELLINILNLYNNRQGYIKKMAETDHTKSTQKILDLIDTYAKF